MAEASWKQLRVSRSDFQEKIRPFVWNAFVDDETLSKAVEGQFTSTIKSVNITTNYNEAESNGSATYTDVDKQKQRLKSIEETATIFDTTEAEAATMVDTTEAEEAEDGVMVPC